MCLLIAELRVNHLSRYGKDVGVTCRCCRRLTTHLLTYPFLLVLFIGHETFFLFRARQSLDLVSLDTSTEQGLFSHEQFVIISIPVRPVRDALKIIKIQLPLEAKCQGKKKREVEFGSQQKYRYQDVKLWNFKPTLKNYSFESISALCHE